MPQRVQRQRKAGQPGIPPGAVYVGRPTKWGNPFEIHERRSELYITDGLNTHWTIQHTSDEGYDLAHRRAVDLYRSWFESGDIRGLTDLPGVTLPPRLERIRRQLIGDVKNLAGYDLACWCPPGHPCHADALLEIANA